MPAPEVIKNLVQRFGEQLDVYRSGSYNETPVRRDFIDPFFKALGWDIDNEAGYAETYRDVIHEDKVTVEGKSKSPDYSFRVGGMRKFFVEAKKPSVSIKNDKEPAFQLRRYGWSGKLPVSILTDFEELAIYDCTLKPALTDSASKGRINYYTFDQYVDKWDEIEELFSKKAVLKGSFDRFADKKKRGTTTVDEDFLLEIEKWRQTLASSIFKQNNITPRNLNYAVQMTIDRIIFLRICEDRGIEPYGRLEKLKNSKDIYKKLVSIFKDADDKYNSGLFHFDENENGDVSERDRITLKLKIEDAPLQEMLSGLYFPNPYEFSVIPADILGQVYERFLGKVIDVVGENVIIEEKPEVKKSGGVFYTPTYIVDYIIKHTLEEILKTKTPKQVEKLRILDPACGSGSFLIVAFQRLLDWHLAYYEANGGMAKFKRVLQPTQTGGLRLTTAERKRILLANIYGVDIDSQAVEVTKLSLLLKVLEGENIESINSQFKLFHERALPDLGSNIKCGNSLVGSDFYAQANLPELSEDDHYRINTFDWSGEYPAVFKNGGFDVVIGNPPYIFARGENFTSHEKEYFYKKFKQQNYQLNTYPIFIEHGIDLLREEGVFGFITPNNWLTISTLKKFRDYLISNVGDLRIVSYKYKVFDGANVDTATITLRKCKPTKIALLASSKPDEMDLVREYSSNELLALKSISFSSGGSGSDEIIEKMNFFPRLGSVANIKSGLKAYQVGKGKPVQTSEVKNGRRFHASSALNGTFGRYLQGVDVKRYLLDWSGEWLSYGDWLAEPRRSAPFEGMRILVRQIPSKRPYMINACIAADLYYNDINSMVVFPKTDAGADLKVILGLLNSKLLSFWFDQTYQKLQRGIFPQFKVNELEQFPMALNPSLNLKIVEKVDQIIALQRPLESGINRIAESRIRSLNAQLDELACQAFGITDEERKQIEEAFVSSSP